MRPRSTYRFFVFYGLTVVMALLSNYLFTGEWIWRTNEIWPEGWTTRLTSAAWCLAASIALSMWCFNRNDDYVATLRRSERSATGEDSQKWEWTHFIPALVLFFAANLIYLVRQENSSVRWCWFLSVIFLLVPLLKNHRWSEVKLMPFAEYMLLAVVVMVAFAVRFTNLSALPLHVDNDVSIMGLFSRALMVKNDFRWVGMAPTDHQYSEHQFLALSMRLFGDNHYGLTMLSVLSGTATVAAVHFLGKILFNRWVGLISAAFLAFNSVHIHFSRIVFGPLTTFFGTLAAVFLLYGFRKESRMGFALSGVCTGLGLLGYYSGRVLPVILFCAFVVWLWQRKKYPGISVWHWVLSFAGMIFTFGPNLIYAFRKSDKLHGRGNEVIIWTVNAWHHLSLKYASQGDATVVWKEQIRRTLLAPFYYPDASTICYLREPMMGAFTVLCFTLGLGYCLRRWKDIRCFYPLAWMGLTFICGGILTIDPPFWPHLNIAMPAMALIAGVGAERFCRRMMESCGGWARLVVPVGLLAAIIFSGLQEWRLYDRFASQYATNRSHAMRQIERLTPDYQVYLVSNNMKWEQEVFQFFTPQVEGHNLNPEDIEGNLPEIDKPTAFFIFSDMDPKYSKMLAKMFPNSSRRLYVDGWGAEAFTMFRVFPPNYVELPQSLKPRDKLWNTEGWVYVSITLLVLMAVGWMAYKREHDVLIGKTPPVESSLISWETPAPHTAHDKLGLGVKRKIYSPQVFPHDPEHH